MDEYDVYMDAVTRRIATETLLEFSVENPANQFLFFTPQDLQAVEDAKDGLEKRRVSLKLPPGYLRVFNMPAPRADAAAAAAAAGGAAE